jgi:ATP-dependent RNA helicase RhlE
MYARQSARPASSGGKPASFRVGTSNRGPRPFSSNGPSKPSRFGGSRFSAVRSSGPRSGGGGFAGGRRGRKVFSGPKREKFDFNRFIKPAEKVEVKKYVATHTFSDFPFVEQLQKNIAKKGFIHPTPIQDQAIKPVLSGKDIFGLANTGTGKTGAFILPLIDRAARSKNEKVLILAPTRELAQQIQEEFRALSLWLNVFSVAAVGGLPITKQISEIRRGVTFVIGTPGRVTDLLKRKALDLSTYNTIVLDEADRMLDMGFKEDMEFIIGKCMSKRQVLFFSATLSAEVKKLTEKYLKDPTFISVVTGDTSKNVEQDIVRARTADKLDRLHDILIKDGSDKVLIFRETKRSVDTLETELKARGFKVAGIHGDKRNRDRIRTLDAFKKNQVTILIATDVAARGLDIPDVTHVINYDMPNDYDTYVHRIGRTGRADKKGTALTFVPA